MSDRKIENIYALTRKSGFLPCHPEHQRRIFAVSIEKRFLVTLFLRMTKGEAFYINIKQNFFPCHPERQRRILCTFDSEKILRHCVPQNDKRRQISY